MELRDEESRLKKTLPNLVASCDHRGCTVRFENTHPEINILQYPALYQFYPELAAFYGQFFANLCGYYAAYFACILNNIYQTGTLPTTDSKTIIQRLNTRKAFNLFFNVSELVIKNSRNTKTVIHDLTMDEIWSIIRVRNPDAAKHTVLLTFTEKELIRYGCEDAMTQFQLKQIPYFIIILGTILKPIDDKIATTREDALNRINHWFTILIRRTESGTLVFIIADSANENRSQDPNFLAIYSQLFLS